jgi:4-amino-4-deoxy-L-arabinose transferase-like glycosyltransferase
MLAHRDGSPCDRSRGAMGIVLAIAALQGLVHLLPNGAYGPFRDELYYVACARRPALGYVDHPPLAPWLLALQLPLTGDSILALRLLPALATAATVVLAAAVARRMGGGGFARFLTALAVALAPIQLILGDFFSMNAFELLLWTAAGYAFVRLASEEEPRWWLAIGALLGLAALNKHTAAVYGLALGVGVLLTRQRRWLATRWPWLGAAIALVLVAPNLLWQVQQGWPSLEFYRNAQAGKNLARAPFEMLAQQVLTQGPGALPIWIAGLWFLLRKPDGRPWRALGWAWVVVLALLVLSASSRPDRVAGAFPVLMAAGATQLERVALRPRRGWLRPVLVAAVLVSGLALAPISLAAVPPAITARYMGTLGGLLQIEEGATASLPQWLADRRGWEELAVEVERVLDALSEEDRAQVVILTTNYGRAGALEYYADQHRLAPVICGHNSYFLWSQGRTDAPLYLAFGFRQETLEGIFEVVERVGTKSCTLCMDYENDVPIWFCAEPRVPLSTLWNQLKGFG